MTQTVQQRVLAARAGVAAVFALNGLAVASWFARVPTARDALGLTPGQLGVLMLALSVGSLLAMTTAGALTRRLGTSRTVAVATLLLAVGLAVVGVAIGPWPAVWAVGVGLFTIGFGTGSCEVAMNVEGAAVERRLGRVLLPRFHAAWSLGTVTGAGLGAGSAQVGFAVVAHLALVAAVVLAGTLLAVRTFLSARPDPTAAAEPTAGHPDERAVGRRRAPAAWRERRTLLIGLFVLVMAFTEGTANDWLAVAFVDGRGVSAATGAVAFGVFVAMMTLGRTFGTLALERWGRVPVLLVTMLLAAAGALTTVLAGSLGLALVGVAIWGAGVSLGFPVGMSAAADEEHLAPARVSVVAAIGYTAFLAGPPLVGLLGDRIGTLRALLIIPIVLIPALALVPVTRPVR